MTIAELITILQDYDPSTRVVVDAYKAGFNDVSCIRPIGLKLSGDHSLRQGEYHTLEGGEPAVHIKPNDGGPE